MARLTNVTTVLYVWSDGGSDANPGTAKQPLKSLLVAVQMAKKIHDAEVWIRFLPAGRSPGSSWGR